MFVTLITNRYRKMNTESLRIMPNMVVSCDEVNVIINIEKIFK